MTRKFFSRFQIVDTICGGEDPPSAYPGGFLAGLVKRPKRDVHHSAPSNVEIKNEWSRALTFTPTPRPVPSWHENRQVYFTFSNAT